MTGLPRRRDGDYGGGPGREEEEREREEEEEFIRIQRILVGRHFGARWLVP